MDLKLLDGFSLVDEGLPVTTTLGCQRLLTLLAFRDCLPRSTAAGILWPESTEARALANLRTALWQLGSRRAETVATDDHRLRLCPTVDVDVRALTEWTTRICESAEPAEDDLDTSRAGTGELLPGWDDDWVEFERERLRVLRLHAFEILAIRLGRCGRYSAAIQVALETIRLDPLRESAHHALILVHLSEGNVVEAVRDFRVLRTLLRDELGVAPSPRLCALLAASGVGSP
jgi:DNA-binding SARP family transcriptional activator